MKTFCRLIVFLIVLCLIDGEVSTFGQAIPYDTGDLWPQAIHEGLDAYRLKEFPKAEDAFRRAEAALPASLTGSLPHCLTRMLLAETCFELSKPNEAERLTDEVVLQLKKASRSVDLKNCPMTGKANIYRFQTGAALYLRAARLYARMNQYDKGERLFEPALELFKNPVVVNCVFLVGGGQAPSEDSRQLGPNPSLSPMAQSGSTARTFYPMRHLRMAEIHETRARFYLLWGKTDRATKSFQDAENIRQRSLATLSTQPNVQPQSELIMDGFVVTDLSRPLLIRVMRDLNFLQLSDDQAARFLQRHALILRKAGRVGDAEAFLREAHDIAPAR